LERLKAQIPQNNPQQQPAINQTFQLAPNANYTMRFANTVDEVNKEIVTADTPFFSKDMSILWIKNNKNEIKTYELNEIEPKDEKDIKIDFLMAQIEQLKKEMKNNEPNTIINEPITNSDESKEPSDVSNVSKSAKKSK
jgi:hypothetical protein